MFHRHFPETMISATSIARIYKKAKIRFKSIKKKKPSETMDQNRLHEWESNMRRQMLNEIEKGSKIIFVDEAIFSPATMLKRTWSLPNDNVKIIDMRDKV